MAGGLSVETSSERLRIRLANALITFLAYSLCVPFASSQLAPRLFQQLPAYPLGLFVGIDFRLARWCC